MTLKISSFFRFPVRFCILIVLFYNFTMSNSFLFGRLIFRHGPVSSAKTMNLLAAAYNYRVQGKTVALLKVSPSINNRI